MSLISAANITIESPTETLIRDASFSINDGDRIGLVGNNGSGKSTLLKCLVGEEPVQAGRVTRQKGLRIGYIEQSLPPELEDRTLYEVIEDAIPIDERSYSGYKVDLALDALGASEEIQLKTMRELSGGWRRLALIARTNLDDPDVLLLDEPTNHLDVGKVLRLENWLRDVVYAPYLIISHDRRFLDETTNKTLFLRGQSLRGFNQSYSKAIEILSQEDASAEARRESEQNKIDQLTNTAKRFKQQAKGHGSERLARTASTLETRIERMEGERTEVYREDERKIKLEERQLDSNRAVIKVENLTIRTPDGQSLFHIDYLDVKKGERIAIMGLNGSGKSLFLKHLMGEFKRFKQNPRAFAPEGIIFNEQVEIGYLDQELSTLPDDVSLIDYIRNQFVLDQTRGIAVLASAGFEKNQQEFPIGTLSFGEKVRLAFAALRIHQPNTFILDEPTNHLDVDGQKRLVDTIDGIDAPCLLVSHDRQFVDEVANRFVVISAGQLIEISDPELFYRASYQLVSQSGTEIDLVSSLGKDKPNIPLSQRGQRGIGL